MTTGEEACPSCQYFRIGTLAHVEGFLLKIDYQDVPVCLNRVVQTRWIKTNLPRDIQKVALENIPLPIPVNFTGIICKSQFWSDGDAKKGMAWVKA